MIPALVVSSVLTYHFGKKLLEVVLRGLWTGQVMPEVSRFFGIIIRMFVEAGGQHHMPHFHAYYHEHVGIYDIGKIERLAGSLPRRQERLVLAWAELHQKELMSNWQTLQAGRPPIKIEPLK